VAALGWLLLLLPRIVGVQSHHADPVYRYYEPENPADRNFEAVTVKPSVAQAAMIGNPVSFPRVKHYADQFEALGGPAAFQVVQVTEQQIMEAMLLANRHGHIADTQGGECLAGLIAAKEAGLIENDELAVLDATAHMLKFIGFQEMYFENSFPPEYGVTPDPAQVNKPQAVLSQQDKDRLPPEEFTVRAAEDVATRLSLAKKAG
jgi:threonine synthase